MTEGHTLAIENLPLAVSGLFPGRVYLVRHDGVAPISQVIWPSLLNAAEAQWVTGSEAASEIAADYPLAVRMREAIASGGIQVFQRNQNRMAEQPGRIVEELNYFGVKKGALLVIDCPQRFFDSMGAAASTMDIFRGFARDHASALVLVARLEDSGLAIGADCLAGSAIFRMAEDGPRWDVSYWFGAVGMAAGASFRLLSLDGGGFGIEGGALRPQQPKGFSDDETAIVVTRAALSGKKAPEGWKVVEDFIEAETLVGNVSGATIILHFDQGTVLGELTRLVFNLRRSCGKQVKILIRQVNAHLRYSQEQLLLRLGANFVIPAEVLFSHLNGFVEMVRGQVYAHDLESDYEEMIGRVMPGAVQGYLLPQAFVAAARETVARSRALVIRNTLVTLKLAPGLTPAEAMRSCWMKRKGDCCTADEENVYLFLFACRESNIDLTLDRQFSYPVSVLFEGQEICLVEEDILRSLARLEDKTKGGTYPEITLINPMDSVGANDKGWLPVTADHHAHSRPAPPVAVKRPLVLRGTTVLP